MATSNSFGSRATLTVDGTSYTYYRLDAVAGIAGSTVIGRYCLIGGGARILGHLQLADHVEIAAHTLVGKSIREAGSYAAIFPFSKTEDWRKNTVHLRHLDDLVKRVKTLEQEFEALKRK